MFLLSKKVRENDIKVVITGEGADEMFAGYDIFKEMLIRRFWAKYPSSKYRPMLLRNLYPYIPQIQNMNAGMLKFVFGYKLEEINNPFYAHLLRWNNGSHIRRHFSERFLDQIKEFDPYSDALSILPDNYTGWESLSQAQYVETKLLMSNYLLSSQGDRMGMGNSIEGRYPFLDYRVIEFAAKLPPSYKMKGLNEKYILKKAMAGRIPESVLKRSKQAYRAPITSAFIGKQKPDYVLELLKEQTIRDFGIFDNSQVDKLLKKFDTQQNISENDTMALTAILSTQMFYAMYIKKTYRPLADKPLLKPIITDKQNSSITIQ